jgi:hypothetical protein
MRAAHAASIPVRRFRSSGRLAGELLHTSTMPALEDAPPQMEMAAATEEVAAEALAARHYEYL